MKWWQSLIGSIITHVLVLGVGVIIGKFIWTDKTETITVDLTDSQKKVIEQEARIGWITLDSAKALIVSESKINWIPVPVPYDSLVITDSLNIRDSIIYIPVYTTRDTIIQFNDTTETATVSLAIMLKQRFFPIQERFASELKLMSLTVDVPKEEERTYGHYMIGLGIGTRFEDSYFFGDFTYKLVNTEHFEIPIALRMEYNINKVLSGGIETKLQVKF